MQGGMGDFTNEVAKELVALGCRVSIVTSKKAAGIQQPASDFRLFPVIERWNWSCWNAILGLLRELRPDVLNIQYQTAAYGMRPAVNFLPLLLHLPPPPPTPPPTRGRAGWGSVVTFHDVKVPYLFPKAGPVRWWVNLAIARWSDAVIATNEEDYARLRPYPFIRRLSIVRIGSNIAPQPPADYDRAAWRVRWGIQADETLLAYFGFLNESKGGETLISALAELVRRGLEVKLLMVGGQVGDSDPTNIAYLERVKLLINVLGLNERVLWSGYTPQVEVSANLLAADIGVLPYRDGASFRRGSFMAALAHSLPIVSTTPRVELRDLRDSENIALVPPDDPIALADRIAELAVSAELRRRLGHGAKELSKQFEWGPIAEQTLKVYEQVTRG
jgi:glycosyltransferase involved in cell wall biosynthesis